MAVGDAISALCQARGDALAVLTMSAIVFWPELREDDYRLLGLMGGAGSIGLGLAIGAPERRVIVVDGDGSLQMQLGVLAAIAGAGPRNLVHAVIDNRIYAVSGGQPTAGSLDWAGMMLAAGYPSAVACQTPEQLGTAVAAATDGPVGIVARCRSERPSLPPAPFASIRSRDEARRLRAALARGRASGKPQALR